MESPQVSVVCGHPHFTPRCDQVFFLSLGGVGECCQHGLTGDPGQGSLLQIWSCLQSLQLDAGPLVEWTFVAFCS